MAELPVTPLGEFDDEANYGTVQSVTPTASSLLLSAATPGLPRKGLITNDSSVKVAIKFGGAASLTDAHVVLAVGGTYELKQRIDDAIYVIGSGTPTGKVFFAPIADA